MQGLAKVQEWKNLFVLLNFLFLLAIIIQQLCDIVTLCRCDS